MQGSEIRDLYSFDRIKITDQGFDGEDGKFIFTASPDERFTPLCHAYSWEIKQPFYLTLLQKGGVVRYNCYRFTFSVKVPSGRTSSG